jgi:Ca-activated chloride channel family protein
MIKLNKKTIKNKINKDINKDVLKLELKGIKTKKQTKDRIPLNISLVIDCSGSMSAGIDRNSIGMLLNNFKTKEINDNEFSSKIEMAKKSALKFIENLNEKDYISIVLFGDKSKVLIPNTNMNIENKKTTSDIIKKEISPNMGMTNLYDGWLDGIKEVTKNINEESLNRVIILTDGQVNSGETRPSIIKEAVLKMYEASISTSTFGIGEDFNEDLLQTISNNGGGNSYYINNNTSFVNFIQEEITGITNIVAKNIKFKIDFNKNFKESNLINDGFEKDSNDFFIISSINKEQSLSMIYNLKYKKLTNKSTVNIGDVIIEYTDEDNKLIKIEETLKFKVCESDEWSALNKNKDVLIEKELMEISKLKTKAKESMDQGNILRAKELINNISESKLSDYDSKVYAQECSKMENLIATMDNNEIGNVRKLMSYESYYTQRGK